MKRRAFNIYELGDLIELKDKSEWTIVEMKEYKDKMLYRLFNKFTKQWKRYYEDKIKFNCSYKGKDELPGKFRLEYYGE